MSPDRLGNFTSSEIVALTKSGKKEGSLGAPALTYIEECNMERRLGRPLENEADAKPTSWGKLIESRAFELLGLEYTLCSQETLSHPTIDCWKGSPDACKEDGTVVDIKCPITLKSFCQLVDGMSIEAVRNIHPQGEKYYWQIVSNAILTNSKYGELIVYVPYRSELEAIKDLASSAGESGEYTKWIYYASEDGLPFLIDGGHYKNLNIIRFEIPDSDKEFLTNRVLECKELLQEFTMTKINA